MKIAHSDILTAFDDKTIGTKVINHEAFQKELTWVVVCARDDFPHQRIPGQAVLGMPNIVIPHVSAGVGKRTQNPDDYVARLHRGKVGLYLKRKHAAPCDGVRVVVYTIDAYLKDPDITPEEAERVKDATHVLVAVLGSAGPPSPLTPGRFVHNLAGGNNEALDWTANEIRDKAKEIKGYYNEWCSVAD